MSFLEAAIHSIREWAGELEGWRKEIEFVPLAAHLFAVGTQLLLNEGSARVMVRLERPTPRTDLELLRRHLTHLSDTLDGAQLYKTIISSLITIEEVLRKEPALLIPRFTDLTPLRSKNPAQEEEVRGIGGRVYHWMRPPSVLAALRDQRFEHAKSPPPDPMPHPGIYLSRLSLYWDSDFQLPRLTRVPANPRIAPFFRDSGEDASVRKNFRIALCPLEGPFHPRFFIQDNGRFFQAHRESPMEGAAELEAYLETLVEAAVEEEIHLILFPELTIDRSARGHLQEVLRRCDQNLQNLLYGVVAGSFHLWDETTGPDEPPVNETVFLDRIGAPVSIHHKKGRFRITSSKVSPKLFTSMPSDLRKEIFEDIRYGSELRILETSLGRLAILICADAIAADDRGYLPLIRRLRPDLLLVVAMSDETEPFEAFAEEMSRYWIGTVFVNAHRILQEAEEARRAKRAQEAAVQEGPAAEKSPHLAAWNLALYEAEGCPPTLGRWKLGQEPESLYFKRSAKGPKGWRRLSQDPDPNGISLLRRRDQILGVVLDLGVHWSTENGK